MAGSTHGAIAVSDADLAAAPRPSIVFVSTSLVHGGAEHQVALLACGLARRGWEVRVVSMRPPEAHLNALASAGVEVISLDMPRRVPDPRGLVHLIRRLRRWRPDIVHGHMVHANLLTRIARPFARTPVVISTAHNINEGPRWREVAYRLTDWLADLTTNVSTAAVSRYIEVRAAPRRKIRHMPNGIDLARFQRDDIVRERLRAELGIGDRVALLAVGRFEEAKDHANLIGALQRVVAQHPHAVLLLVGQGRLEEATRERVAAAGLSGHVRFLGVRTDVPDLMNAADLYVMSSAWEGLPLVLLEAAAAGLPIVATDVGGNSDVVRTGENGVLVPPRDPDALAAAIESMLALPEEARRARGATGRAIVEAEYDIERVLDGWEAIYREFAAPRKLAAPVPRTP